MLWWWRSRSTWWWPYHVTYELHVMLILFMHLILLRTTVALWGDLSLKFQDQIVFSPTVHRCYSSSFRDTTWWSGVIDSTFTYNGCNTIFHMRNTRVKLDEPCMCRHGLGTHETEKSSMNRIVDMISIGMLTTETILNSRDDRTWVIEFGSWTTQMTRDMYFLSGC